MKSYLDELKQGDLVAISHYNSFAKGMLMSANQDSVKYRALPWAETDYWIDRIINREEGNTKPFPASFIRSYTRGRVIPISEDLLTPIEKRYLKFYRTYLNNEYKNNRSGYTL